MYGSSPFSQFLTGKLLISFLIICYLDVDAVVMCNRKAHSDRLI